MENLELFKAVYMAFIPIWIMCGLLYLITFFVNKERARTFVWKYNIGHEFVYRIGFSEWQYVVAGFLFCVFGFTVGGVANSEINLCFVYALMSLTLGTGLLIYVAIKMVADFYKIERKMKRYKEGCASRAKAAKNGKEPELVKVRRQHSIIEDTRIISYKKDTGRLRGEFTYHETVVEFEIWSYWSDPYDGLKLELIGFKGKKPIIYALNPKNVIKKAYAEDIAEFEQRFDWYKNQRPEICPEDKGKVSLFYYRDNPVRIAGIKIGDVMLDFDVMQQEKPFTLVDDNLDAVKAARFYRRGTYRYIPIPSALETILANRELINKYLVLLGIKELIPEEGNFLSVDVSDGRDMGWKNFKGVEDAYAAVADHFKVKTIGNPDSDKKIVFLVVKGWEHCFTYQD